MKDCVAYTANVLMLGYLASFRAPRLGYKRRLTGGRRKSDSFCTDFCLCLIPSRFLNKILVSSPSFTNHIPFHGLS